MERGLFERINSKEEFGRNVEVHAKFIRHAQRESGTSNEVLLTEEGFDKSKELGENLDKKDRIEGEYSPTLRTELTTGLVVFHSPTENKLKTKEREELAFHCSNDFIGQRTIEHVQKALEPKFGKYEYRKLSEERKKEMEIPAYQAGIDYYLKFGDKRPDNETYSPVETAATVAKRLDIAIRKTDRLHSGTKMDAIFTSHDYVIAAFLKEVIIRQTDEGEKIKGFNSLEEIGGPIGFLEGFEIVAKIDDSGQKSIEFIFRDQKYELNMERFKELVKIASRLEKEELEKNKVKSEKRSDEILEEELNKKLGDEE